MFSAALPVNLPTKLSEVDSDARPHESSRTNSLRGVNTIWIKSETALRCPMGFESAQIWMDHVLNNLDRTLGFVIESVQFNF